jgi:hypothetical protein
MSHAAATACATLLAAAVCIGNGCNRQAPAPEMDAQLRERYQLEAAHTHRSPYKSPDELNELWRMHVAESQADYCWSNYDGLTFDDRGNLVFTLEGWPEEGYEISTASEDDWVIPEVEQKYRFITMTTDGNVIEDSLLELPVNHVADYACTGWPGIPFAGEHNELRDFSMLLNDKASKEKPAKTERHHSFQFRNKGAQVVWDFNINSFSLDGYTCDGKLVYILSSDPPAMEHAPRKMHLNVYGLLGKKQLSHTSPSAEFIDYMQYAEFIREPSVSSNQVTYYCDFARSVYAVDKITPDGSIVVFSNSHKDRRDYSTPGQLEFDWEGFRRGPGFLIMLSSNGDMKWKRKLKRRNALPPAIASDGTIYLVIESATRRADQPLTDDSDVREHLANVVAFSPEGEVIWVTTLNCIVAPGWLSQRNVLVDADDSVLIRQSGPVGYDPHLYKVSSEGEILWLVTRDDQRVDFFTLGPGGRLYVYADGEVIAFGDGPSPEPDSTG